MARIRSIKPDFWNSADVRRLSNAGRLAFLYLFTNCDDAGRIHTNPEHLTELACEPGTPVADVRRQLSLMARQGMVVRYKDHGQPAIAIVNWHHQKIDHPTPSRIAEPPRESPREFSRESSRVSAHARADRMDRRDRMDRMDRTGGDGSQGSPQAASSHARGTMEKVSDVLPRVAKERT